MGQRVADTIEAMFLASGASSEISQLAEELSGTVNQNIVVGDELPVTGGSATFYSVIISILEEPTSDEGAFEQIEHWMDTHLDRLRDVDAHKTLEIQSYLDSETGCRIVTVPNSIVRLCGQAGLNVANQAIRVLSKSEYSRLRSMGTTDK